MSLRNVGIYLRAHTASESRRMTKMSTNCRNTVEAARLLQRDSRRKNIGYKVLSASLGSFKLCRLISIVVKTVQQRSP
jgi:hypothetical protein